MDKFKIGDKVLIVDMSHGLNGEPGTIVEQDQDREKYLVETEFGFVRMPETSLCSFIKWEEKLYKEEAAEAPLGDTKAVIAAIKKLSDKISVKKVIVDDDRMKVKVSIEHAGCPGEATFHLRFQTQLIESHCDIQTGNATLEQLTLYSQILQILQDNVELFEMDL